MKIIQLILILLCAVPTAYAAGLETKAQVAATEEQSKANALLANAIEDALAHGGADVQESLLPQVEAALKRGADIMSGMHPGAPGDVSILNAIISSGLQKKFAHDVFNLFFTYNKLNKDNLNTPMRTQFAVPQFEATTSIGDFNMTPFQVCVISETVDLVKKGIAHGGDVNKRFVGKTPLMLLVAKSNHFLNTPETASQEVVAQITAQRERNRQEIAELLIKAGASIDSVDDKMSALDYAVLFNCISVAKILLDRKAKFEPLDALFNAVGDRSLGMVDLLLNYGLDPNGVATDTGGITPLIHACYHVENGQKIDVPIIQRLLKAGADPLLEDNEGHDAAWYLMHIKKPVEDIFVPDTTQTPERLQAIKLLNDAIAKRLKDVKHPSFGTPGLTELMGEYISGETPKKQVLPEEPEEE